MKHIVGCDDDDVVSSEEERDIGALNINDDSLKAYRRNVAAVVLSSSYPFKCRFLVAERIDMKGIWQFPQGGVNDGESLEDALLRELHEEIGTSEVEIVSKIPMWIKYDFPGGVAHRMRPYVGQVQKYFLVRLRNDSLVNINTSQPEFARYEFVDFDKLMFRMNNFKKLIYKRVLQHFRDGGYI